MPFDYLVPHPDAFEERRQTADAVANIRNTLDAVVARAAWLLPGESLEDVYRGWEEYAGSFGRMLEELAPSDAKKYLELKGHYRRQEQSTSVPPANFPGYLNLDAAQLSGYAGKAKRSTLSRLRDRFQRFFGSEPFTRLKQLNAARALADYLELASTFVSSIPVLKEVKEAVVECIDLFRMLAEQRAKRGD